VSSIRGSLSLFFFFFFFGETGVQTQGFTIANQVLYPLSHTSSPVQDRGFKKNFLKQKVESRLELWLRGRVPVPPPKKKQNPKRRK
jgi:hypothetical protein